MSVAEVVEPKKKRLAREDQRTLVPRLRSMTEGKATVMTNVAESPLSWYFDRGIISMVQHEAGERFRQDWEMSQVGSTRTMDLEKPPGSSNKITISDHHADAIGRVNQALKSVGKISGTLIINICGDGHGIMHVEKAFGWKQRYATDRFKEALDDLAEHYGMSTPRKFRRLPPARSTK